MAAEQRAQLDADVGDLALDEGAVLRSLQALKPEIERLHRVLDDDERRATQFPHRARQLQLVRSLGRRVLDAHTEWLAEVEDILGPAEPDGQRRDSGRAIPRTRALAVCLPALRGDGSSYPPSRPRTPRSSFTDAA